MWKEIEFRKFGPCSILLNGIKKKNHITVIKRYNTLCWCERARSSWLIIPAWIFSWLQRHQQFLRVWLFTGLVRPYICARHRWGGRKPWSVNTFENDRISEFSSQTFEAAQISTLLRMCYSGNITQRTIWLRHRARRTICTSGCLWGAST